MNFTFRRAVIEDAKVIHGFLLSAADKGQLLARPLHSIYTHIRDFIILIDEKGEACGCCAVSVTWEDLAEVRSLYVDERLRGKHLGLQMVEKCVELSRDLGVRRIFTLTYSVEFFRALGFTETSKSLLPQKVWTDCLNCPKFPDCDEVAMIMELPPKPLVFEHL